MSKFTFHNRDGIFTRISQFSELCKWGSFVDLGRATKWNGEKGAWKEGKEEKEEEKEEDEEVAQKSEARNPGKREE